MPLLLIIVIALHVLSSVFWAGSTFAMARVGGTEAPRLFGPQMGAAGVAVLTGGALWGLLHRGGFGTSEAVLAGGALAALLALAVQVLGVGRGLRAGSPVAGPYRASAGLLAITIVCMAIARYV
ncbi:hypothetical protein [Caulobacter sp. 1776]|uniref:hypothetical protein n=1 Tax=Caulobacter sp. 1776 TaxID=3156420 RepID=UPI0033932F52